MDEASAREILTWRYEPPYDIYNADPDEAESFIQALLDPGNAYHTFTDEHGNLVGYCCFGADARVPGGDYGADALDIGLGMRPDLTDQGRGFAFFAAIVDFARRRRCASR
jgi:ribosomal-protein-alanine N-acetyltransferase